MVHTDINNNKQYLLNTEHELQATIVEYLRATDLIFCCSLGGYLDTPEKRIRSWQEGYQKGQPDIIIYTPSSGYSGLALELKNPNGMGQMSKEQHDWMTKLEVECNYFCFASNDLIAIIEVLTKYLNDILP